MLQKGAPYTMGDARALGVCGLPISKRIYVSKRSCWRNGRQHFINPMHAEYVRSARVQLGRSERNSLPVRRDIPMQDLARPMQREELNDLTVRIGSMSTQELDALRSQIDREHQNRFQRALEAVCRQFG